MKIESFEEGLEKIEEIISSLENADLSLKNRIEKFKEGAELLKFCDNELKDAEMSIQKIVDKDGKIKFEKFK